jgi:hypothetical protein
MVSEFLDWTFRGNRSTSGRKPRIKGYRVTTAKDGKVAIVKDQRRLNVSQRLQQAASKRIRPARKGVT